MPNEFSSKVVQALKDRKSALGSASNVPHADLNSKLKSMNVIGEYHAGPHEGSLAKENWQASDKHPSATFEHDHADGNKASRGWFLGPDAVKARDVLADFHKTHINPESSELKKAEVTKVDFSKQGKDKKLVDKPLGEEGSEGKTLSFEPRYDAPRQEIQSKLAERKLISPERTKANIEAAKKETTRSAQREFGLPVYENSQTKFISPEKQKAKILEQRKNVPGQTHGDKKFISPQEQKEAFRQGQLSAEKPVGEKKEITHFAPKQEQESKVLSLPTIREKEKQSALEAFDKTPIKGKVYNSQNISEYAADQATAKKERKPRSKKAEAIEGVIKKPRKSKKASETSEPNNVSTMVKPKDKKLVPGSDEDITQRVQRIKDSISRINSLMAELRSNSQGPDVKKSIEPKEPLEKGDVLSFKTKEKIPSTVENKEAEVIELPKQEEQTRGQKLSNRMKNLSAAIKQKKEESMDKSIDNKEETTPEQDFATGKKINSSMERIIGAIKSQKEKQGIKSAEKPLKKAEKDPKFERCVMDVKVKQSDVNPWAVCHASLNKADATVPKAVTTPATPKKDDGFVPTTFPKVHTDGTPDLSAKKEEGFVPSTFPKKDIVSERVHKFKIIKQKQQDLKKQMPVPTASPAMAPTSTTAPSVPTASPTMAPLTKEAPPAPQQKKSSKWQAQYQGKWYKVLDIIDNKLPHDQGGGNMYHLEGLPKPVHHSEIEDIKN